LQTAFSFALDTDNIKLIRIFCAILRNWQLEVAANDNPKVTSAIAFFQISVKEPGRITLSRSGKSSGRAEKQGSHRVAEPRLQPYLFRFNRALSSDTCRGTHGNVDDVRITLDLRQVNAPDRSVSVKGSCI
jgi:hypothetical protein